MAERPDRPVVPRPAATVMIVRPAEAGFEVFMVRRHRASAFAADLFVFPGGTIRADDQIRSDEARAVGLDPEALRARLAAPEDPFARHDDGGLSLWIAAIRELFEEAGVLLAEDPSGRLLGLSDPSRAAHFERARARVQAGTLALPSLARAEQLRLAAHRLLYFSRWITPVESPRRYDTRFFLAELPSGQLAGHCQIETTDGLWIAPHEALARRERREFPMMFVTTEHVRRLSEFDDLPALVAFAGRKSTRPVSAVVDDLNRPYLTPEQRRAW